MRVIRYYRSGPASDFYGDFRRMQLSTEVSLSLANVNPSNNAGTPASVTKNVAAVNQPVTAARAYGVGVCTGNDGSFFGARIKYTYTSAGS
jgi:hypothetical protein